MMFSLMFPGADPFIFQAEGAWWLITSHDAPDGRHLPIYRSVDLKLWEFVRGAVAKGRGPRAWNRRNFWAPEVIEKDGRYYCFYTAMPEGTPGNEGNRVGLAVADRPEGPYEDVGVVIPHGSIDGSPYIDRNGQAWLLFTTEHGNDLGWPPGQIGVFRLREDLRTVEGDPVKIMTQYEWQEGAFFVPHPDSGRLVLFFSYGGWTEDSYCVHAAWGDVPSGPFIPEPEPFSPELWSCAGRATPMYSPDPTEPPGWSFTPGTPPKLSAFPAWPPWPCCGAQGVDESYKYQRLDVSDMGMSEKCPYPLDTVRVGCGV